MYEIDKQTFIQKKKKRTQQKNLHSLKIFNFNSDWNYQLPVGPIGQLKNQSLPNKIVTKYQNQSNRVNKNNKGKYFLDEEGEQDAISKYDMSNNSSNCEKEIFLMNLETGINKKKALSQLQNYKKMDISSHKVRFSKPTQEIQQQDHEQNKQKQSGLVLKSTKLMGLRLPSIKNTARQQVNKAQKSKFQNLKTAKIQQRVKTIKLSEQKQDSQSFVSQANTQIMKNRSRIMAKFNSKNNQLSKINQSIIPQRKLTEKLKRNENQEIQKIKKKVKQIIQVKHKSQRNSIKAHNPQNVEKRQNAKDLTEQKQQIQEHNQKVVELPVIQIYDKKMKIGRKKKSEEDKIRAMLLKTLQKTKGTDYVAQRGTSQANNSSLTPHKKSLSKNSKQGSQQKQKLVLLNNNESSAPSANKKVTFKKAELQRIRNQLQKNNTSRNQTNNRVSQNHHMPSVSIQNKKFVEMVRQNQNKKYKNKNQQLQEIKQQKTIPQEDSISQQQEKNPRKHNQNSEPQQNKYMISLKKQFSSQEISQNQFIPTARRQQIQVATYAQNS